MNWFLELLKNHILEIVPDDMIVISNQSSLRIY